MRTKCAPNHPNQAPECFGRPPEGAGVGVEIVSERLSNRIVAEFPRYEDKKSIVCLIAPSLCSLSSSIPDRMGRAPRGAR